MTNPKDMTQVQKVVRGLKIFEEYLSPRDNPGEIECVDSVLRLKGVHHDAVGGNDLATLEVLGWHWHEKRLHWWIEP